MYLESAISNISSLEFKRFKNILTNGSTDKFIAKYTIKMVATVCLNVIYLYE